MTTSTDGQICFGVLFDEGTEFPWGAAEFDGDIDNWWVEGVHGFKHSFELYDERGGYLGGSEPSAELLDRYYGEKREFEKALPPLPVRLVNVCHIDYPQYILAIPRTVKKAHRGYPVKFEPSELSVSDAERVALLDFLAKYGLVSESEPEWYLSSYWG